MNSLEIFAIKVFADKLKKYRMSLLLQLNDSLDKKYELHKTLRWDQAVCGTRAKVDQSVFILRANAAVKKSLSVTCQNDSLSSWAVFF